MPHYTTPATAPERRYVRLEDAAARLDCNPKTLRRRIADGELTGYRLGRLIRVDAAEVETLLTRIPTGGCDASS